MYVFLMLVIVFPQVMCSFLQVYQEKVYDLLNPRFIVDLPVREHPKKGMREISNKSWPLSVNLVPRVHGVTSADQVVHGL